jgi:hypothetical protein
MRKWGLFFVAVVLCAWNALHPAHADTRLTALEARWLDAAAPVTTYARKLQLPLDVIVQPTEQPGHAPVAMGYVDGRCKLVLSMRGNPAVESLEALPPARFEPVVEAMAAHELAHCWRYVQGQWHTVPAGFVDPPVARVPLASIEAARDLRDTRREEGFADLVGLAWAYNRYPADYAWVHAWFTEVRDDPEGGGHHDTAAWVRLVRDPSAFGDGDTPFAQAVDPWQAGLRIVAESADGG